MVKIEFQRALKAAEQELEERLAEQQVLERRILDLRQLVVSLQAALNAGSDSTPERGGFARAFEKNRMTDDIRAYFRANPATVIVAKDVESVLQKLGYDMDKYQSPLATIGVILGRLEAKGELVKAESTSGKNGYMAVSEGRQFIERMKRASKALESSWDRKSSDE